MESCSKIDYLTQKPDHSNPAVTGYIALLSMLIAFTCKSVLADVVVRFDFQQGPAAQENVYVKLLDQVAPLTVSNFLQYVNNSTVNGGNYANSFIHRSVSNFIIQGGGFTFDPSNGAFIYDNANNTFPGGLQEVADDPTVQNEFNRSNIRGTLAMAKLGGNPNSATNQWFINLADNASILDGQNGGFTVFGEVIGDGNGDPMTVIDSIATQNTFDLSINNPPLAADIHPAFAEIPLVNFTYDPNSISAVQRNNLVMVNAVSEIFSISADIQSSSTSTDFDFGSIVINTTAQSVITIENRSASNLNIGNIADTVTIAEPFSISNDGCANTTVLPAGSCAFTIEFLPLSINPFSDSFNIEFTNLNLSYSFTIMGEGVALTEPNIFVTLSQNGTTEASNIEFGDVQLFDPVSGVVKEITLFITNTGNERLNFTSFSFSGPDASEFDIREICTFFSPIFPGFICLAEISLKPLSTGPKNATLTIVSDDPDMGSLDISLSGAGALDADGISEAIENAAPNGGDGNNDDSIDSLQNDVVSFLSVGGEYLTIVSNPDDDTINEISVLQVQDLPNAPAGLEFLQGITGFSVTEINTGITLDIGIILPAGVLPTTWYMYGATPNNSNPHWYDFKDDGTTGALALGDVTITSPSGKSIQRSLIRLRFKDGERGDGDLSENGKILALGGPVLNRGGSNNSMSVGSSSINVWFLIIVLLAARIMQKPRCTVPFK